MLSCLSGSNDSFNPTTDIPDLSEKVILVTGGNRGLGKETIKQLAKHNPKKIYMGSRNILKAQQAILDITAETPSARIEVLEIDMASFTSIEAAATKIISENTLLDILINNAGIFALPPDLTKDGYEIQFGTNYMGPALLTRLLLPILEETASMPKRSVRIVNVSSDLYAAAPKRGLRLGQMKTSLGKLWTIARYGQSKLANIYFTRSCAARYPDILSVAVHPGIVRTDGMDGVTSSILAFPLRLVMKVASVDVSTGALNQLWACTDGSWEVESGAYYVPLCKEANRSGILGGRQAEELWQWTEREFRAHGF